MSAVDELFEGLRRKNQKAFIPFITAGDPDLEFTGAVLQELVRRGSSLCEIGIPYSDPIADGPIIQASYSRALERKIRVDQILAALQSISHELSAPIVTMVSYAVIFRRGLEAFVGEAQDAGVAGVIVPDLPVEESEGLARICRDNDLSLIQLVTPTTTRDRALRIIENSTGFVYYVSITGITGERQELPLDVVDSVAWLREQCPLPVCIGFGISRPEHVRVLSPVADGVIVGSAIMRRIGEVTDKSPAQVVQGVGDFVTSLIRSL